MKSASHIRRLEGVRNINCIEKSVAFISTYEPKNKSKVYFLICEKISLHLGFYF